MNALTTTRGTFSLAPRTLDEAMRFADMVANTDLVPKDYRGRPGNILVAIQWGSEVGLGPMQAMQGISVINGRPAVWGDAAMALVRGHRDCAGIREGVDGEGDKAVGWCEVTRRDEKPQRRTFSVADAKKAGLWGKQGPWSQYPLRMLQLRARGFAIRDVFPDALRGVITVEEARDYPMVDVSPLASAAGSGLADAKADMVAMGVAHRVVFPNGASKHYGTREEAWQAIVKAAGRCETLECLSALETDNDGLLAYGPSHPARDEAIAEIGGRREQLSRTVQHDPEMGEIAADAPHPGFDAEAFARQKAREIAGAADEAELQIAMTGDGWAELPEKWAAELRQRAKIRRGQFEAGAAA